MGAGKKDPKKAKRKEELKAKKRAVRKLYEPTPFYVLEPHAHWAKEGQIPINELARRIYGEENFNALGAASDELESSSNDSYIEYSFSQDRFYEEALEDFDRAEAQFYPQSLRCVVADLIRRGELPRGDYLLHHWW